MNDASHDKEPLIGFNISLNRQLLSKKDYNRLVISWNNASDMYLAKNT